MSDPNLPPPPGEGQPPMSPPPPGGGAVPPPPGGTPPPPGGAPPPAGGFGAPPPGAPPPGAGGFPPPAQPYQPAMAGGMGPGGMALAEPWKRIVALLIDGIGLGIIVGIPIAIIVGGGGSSFGSTNFDARPFLAGVISQVIYFLYYALLIGMRGQTVAGMLLGIKVVDQGGSPVTQTAAYKRSAWSLLGLIPCLGGLAQLVLVIWGLVNLFNDPQRQTPWDKFGETVVVDA